MFRLHCFCPALYRYQLIVSWKMSKTHVITLTVLFCIGGGISVMLYLFYLFILSGDCSFLHLSRLTSSGIYYWSYCFSICALMHRQICSSRWTAPWCPHRWSGSITHLCVWMIFMFIFIVTIIKWVSLLPGVKRSHRSLNRTSLFMWGC